MNSLAAVTLRQPVRPTVRFRGFGRAHRPRNAWGVALYPDESHLIYKELRRDGRSDLSSYVSRAGAPSNLFLFHAARLPKGGKRVANTGPFGREWAGRPYAFSLAGRITPRALSDGSRFRPLGSAPAEVAFCNLLTALSDRGVTDWSADDHRWLRNQLERLGVRSTYSCCLSDGEHLFCYRGREDDEGIGFRSIGRAGGVVSLDFQIGLLRHSDDGMDGFAVANAPEETDAWTLLEPGELVVFRRGRLVHFAGGAPRPL